jgi:hypothetical protein
MIRKNAIGLRLLRQHRNATHFVATILPFHHLASAGVIDDGLPQAQRLPSLAQAIEAGILQLQRILTDQCRQRRSQHLNGRELQGFTVAVVNPLRIASRSLIGSGAVTSRVRPWKYAKYWRAIATACCSSSAKRSIRPFLCCTSLGPTCSGLNTPKPPPSIIAGPPAAAFGEQHHRQAILQCDAKQAILLFVIAHALRSGRMTLGNGGRPVFIESEGVAIVDALQVGASASG